jgi:CBS-domain-containing membrane protein
VLQRRERRRGRRIQPRFRLAQIGVTSLGGLCAVGLLALLSVWSGQVLIVAPLGASSVLLFGYPRSPLAQPRNVVLGNTLGGGIGVGLVALLGQGPLVLALAVALTILLGQQLRCLHPPAGGMAFLVVFLGVRWHFLLFPVLSGCLLLVLMAWAFSRLVPGAMRYPLHWHKAWKASGALLGMTDQPAQHQQRGGGDPAAGHPQGDAPPAGMGRRQRLAQKGVHHCDGHGLPQQGGQRTWMTGQC